MATGIRDRRYRACWCFMLPFVALTFGVGFMAGTFYHGGSGQHLPHRKMVADGSAHLQLASQQQQKQQTQQVQQVQQVQQPAAAASGSSAAATAQVPEVKKPVVQQQQQQQQQPVQQPQQKQQGGQQQAASKGQAKLVVREGICTNTCAKANNGVCDDGRAAPQPDKANMVLCDLGTDCDDCGPWTPTVPPVWKDREEGPIALLTRKGVEVRVRPTAARASKHFTFQFAYTDPKKDTGVGGDMERAQLLEPPISKIFMNIFKKGCKKADGSRALFVDVGSNFGWFSVMAATMGCRAIAYEPVPHFRAFLEYNLALNDVAGLVDVRANIVSGQGGQNMKIAVPSGGIWGTASVETTNIDKNSAGKIEEFVVPTVTLDDQIKEEVLLMKVDVEGWEWSVFAGAKNMLKTQTLHNVIMEYSPGVAERARKADDLVATVQILIDLINNGFRIAHDLDFAGNDFAVALPAFEEVTLSNLKYDMQDAKLIGGRGLGCPHPPELSKVWGAGACTAIPEDISPRSLHSMIGHNTNVWASKDRELQRLEGVTGMVHPDAPASTYFINNTHNVGMGHRDCKSMDPRFQVRHRCRCTNPSVCGEEERLVTELAAAGKIPSNYVI